MSATLFILLAHPAQILALDVDTGECRTVLAPDDGSPDGVQVDASNGVIYWTSMGAWPDHGEDFLNPDGTIESCLVDGTGRSTLVGGGTIVTPKQLQFDAMSTAEQKSAMGRRKTRPSSYTPGGVA